MKKVFLAVLLVVGLTTFAQERGERREGKEKLTPEQRMEFHLKKMTKDLSLNDKQVAQIRDLMTKQNAEREAKKAEMEKRRASGVKPTPEEREAMKAKMQEKQGEMKAEMEKILTPDQFAKWQENFDMKKEKIQEKRAEKKELKKSAKEQK